MRAAVLSEPGGGPAVREFDEPRPADGSVLIDVTKAGLGAWDILAGDTLRLPVEYPCVVRGEGVGFAPDGRRVYFGEYSAIPFGAWAQRTVVPAEEVWDVPDDIDDHAAITMAIAGTGALVPLELAQIREGESVLVLGATGALGQIGLQVARRLGAGRVVGAARDRAALRRLTDRGIADAVVGLGTADDAGALQEEAGDGFDVVLDIVHGDPFSAALKATRQGARVMCIGAQAGRTTTIDIGDLLFRTVTCIGSGHAPPADRHAAWLRGLALTREEPITVDYADYTLDQAPEAWARQAGSPHAKVIATISG